MYLKLEDIQEVQIDHTSRCNLQCPQCARTTDNWSQLPHNQNLDLTLEDYKILLSPFEENRIRVFHCGNYGDALTSPTFDETFNFTLSKNPKRIDIATNGSMRSPEWWKDLAQRGGNKLKVIFSVDGLEDTNGIYRIGSSFDKIMANAEAFIKAGGHARWDYIEFKHNYHQIDEAQKRATDLGFKEFNVKYTARFADQNATSVTARKQEIKDTETNVNQKDRKEVVKEYGSFDEYVDKTKISCKSQKNKSVFVDMNMRLWPCCWFGAPMYFNKVTEQTKSFDHFLEIFGKNFNNLREHGWEILNHDFYSAYLKETWDSPNEKAKRIFTCGRTCGEKFEFSSGYGKNRNVKTIERAEV